MKVENLKRLHQILSDTMFYIMYIPIIFHSAIGFINVTSG
jgi:hypothetical protein